MPAMTPPISLWPTESEERMKIKRVSDRSLEHFTFDGLRESDYSDFPLSSYTYDIMHANASEVDASACIALNARIIGTSGIGTLSNASSKTFTSQAYLLGSRAPPKNREKISGALVSRDAEDDGEDDAKLLKDTASVVGMAAVKSGGSSSTFPEGAVEVESNDEDGLDDEEDTSEDPSTLPDKGQTHSIIRPSTALGIVIMSMGPVDAMFSDLLDSEGDKYEEKENDGKSVGGVVRETPIRGATPIGHNDTSAVNFCELYARARETVDSHVNAFTRPLTSNAVGRKMIKENKAVE
ncbi:hypothetical protein GN244_ATG09186 [Phytophthora infestans]|uniref:Uncharacterized protein n=1 Tax=Phytophthora infestans TaxID=4787 RepID=A0A833WV43_PHYIN|nr:hypothetical protein GN244_ATG09186 [Phytophthora infestans]